MLLCCGEALIDMIPAPLADGRTGYVPYSGGAVFNTAIALGRLGIATGMLTGLSTDLFGDQLAGALANSHVDTSLCVRSKLPTTLAFVSLENGQASYTFYDENSAGRMLSGADIPPLPKNVNALFFGGISLAVEPCADAYADLLCMASEEHVVMLDPNIRPDFIGDTDRYRARLDRILSHANIVKISDEDLAWIFPDAEPVNIKARRLQASGPSIVIVTRGAEGATALLKDQAEVSVAARSVAVVDTVGAGDTFNAGVLAALANQDLLTKKSLLHLSKEAVQTALSYGAEAAALSVSRAGANPPWREELPKSKALQNEGLG
mgnify:CR=1 FL=1